jgi:hypothetical protein
MTSKIFSADIMICATVYVKAESEAEAIAKIGELRNTSLELEIDEHGELPISGRRFDDPGLPDVSLSPVMTIGQRVGDLEEAA